MSGMFSHIHNGGAVARRLRQYQRRQTVRHFADALADSGDIPTAAKRAHISASYAKQLFREMRRELGWQAQ